MPPEAPHSTPTINQLEGSDDKDTLELDRAKIAGAEVNSSAYARAQGIASLASPVSKRIALSMLSLECARTSVLMFRRPLMSILLSSYGTVDARKVEPSRPKLSSCPVLLPRSWYRWGSVTSPLPSAHVCMQPTLPSTKVATCPLIWAG